MPKISIIMNCFNGEEYLQEAIESIYNQTYSDWEIIFWDNASTDNSANIAKSYDERIKYYLAPKTTSLGQARNLALNYASGEYLAFLDCDDIWNSNKLAIQLDILESNQSYQMCYSGVIYIDEIGNFVKKTLPKSSNSSVFDTQLKSYEIGMQSVLIRNNIKIDFNKELEFSPDFDLMMRIAASYKVYVINEHLIKYRVVTNSLTNQKIDKWSSEMKFTLDNLKKNKDLYIKHESNFNLAYAKVEYNKARYLFSQNKRMQAITALSRWKFISVTYFLLYISALLGNKWWNTLHKLKK